MKEITTKVVKLAGYSGAAHTEITPIWENGRGHTSTNTFWRAGDAHWYTKDGVRIASPELNKMLDNIEQRELDKARESQQ